MRMFLHQMPQTPPCAISRLRVPSFTAIAQAIRPNGVDESTPTSLG